MISAPELDPRRSEAIAELRRIVEADDPLYKPAKFLLALALLDAGDDRSAEPLFVDLMRPDEERAAEILESIQKEWIRKRLRFVPVVPLLRFWIDRWVRLYDDIGHALTGGIVYLYAQWWIDLRELLDAPVASVTGMTPEAATSERDADIDAKVSLFRQYRGIHRYVKIAAGRERDRVTPARAREVLDVLLDREAIGEFTLAVKRLESDLFRESLNALRQRYIEDRPTFTPSVVPPSLADVRAHLLAHFYERALNRFESAWRKGDLDECGEIIRFLLHQTEDPSKYRAVHLLQQVALPPRLAPLIRFFIPAFGLLDPWRDVFTGTLRVVQDTTNLYLESKYGKHLAEYSRDDDESLKAARAGATKLLEHLERAGGGRRPRGRVSELTILAYCLESDATVRYVLRGSLTSEGEKTEAEQERTNARHEFESSLREKVKTLRTWERTVESSVERGAVLRSLGLIARYLGARSVVIYDLSLPLDEAGYFEQARDTGDSAEVYLCLVENAERRDQRQVAREFVFRALALAPYHARARALMERLGEPGPRPA